LKARQEFLRNRDQVDLKTMDIGGTGGRDNAGLEVFFFRSFASAVRFSKTIVGDDGSNGE